MLSHPRMSCTCPTKSMPSQSDIVSYQNPQHLYGEASMAWVRSLDDFERQLRGQFDSGNQLSTDSDLEVDTNQPLHHGDNATSEEITPPPSGSSSLSTSPVLAPNSYDFAISQQELSICNRKKRRQLQNRNSQRAFRNRAQQKQSEMTSIIEKLQAENEELRMHKKSSNVIVQVLSEEIERLKDMGLAFPLTGI